MGWRDIVQITGQSAEKVHAAVLVVVTDSIDRDGTYHVEAGGYCGASRLRARTRIGVDCLLQEFGIPDTSWSRRG